MKQNEFHVWFENDYVAVMAFNRTEALILAQAKRINDGKRYANYGQIEQMED